MERFTLTGEGGKRKKDGKKEKRNLYFNFRRGSGKNLTEGAGPDQTERKRRKGRDGRDRNLQLCVNDGHGRFGVRERSMRATLSMVSRWL